jgi:hypothetical protein
VIATQEVMPWNTTAGIKKNNDITEIEFLCL